MVHIAIGAPRGAAVFRSSVAILALAIAAPAFAADDAATSAAAVDAAAAADAAEYGEPIVVTARHREENSQDVPVAISVVDAGTLDRTGSFTLNQIQQLVPSLQITSFNPRNSSINIRGLGANSSIAVDGLEYGVGYYLDGVYFGRPGQSQFDLVDLAQVEVLRGPQGTLFGKNTTAGAINVTSRLPSFDPELTVEASLGNYDYHQFRASGSLPIIADKVALRISVADTHRGGFSFNRYTSRKAQDYDNFTVRGQLLIKPDPDVTIRLIGDYSKQTLHASLSLIDGYFTTYGNGAPIANSIFDRAARLNYSLPTTNAFDRVGDADSPFQANMESYGASGEIDWDLGSATLTAITAYRWWDWYPANDTDGTSLPIMTKAQQLNFQRQFSQELRIASNGRNTIDYQFGLFYFWQSVRGYGSTQYGKDFAAWNFPSSLPPAALANFTAALSGLQADTYSDPVTKSYAAFGQVDWHIADALTLTAGLRYTHEDKKGSFSRFIAPDSGGNRNLLPPALQAQFQVSDLDFAAALKADALTGAATLSYKAAPDLLIYGTYSRGEKSGGLNVTAGGAARPVVDPETVNAFEIGVKSQFLDNRLTLNAAAFRTEISDYQTTISETIGDTTANIQYIANIPKVRSQGVEADLSFAPSKWFSVAASIAYTDAKFVSFVNSPQAPDRANEGAVQDLSGRSLPGVSKFAYTLGVDAAQPLSSDIELYAHADYLHRSSFNSSAALSSYGVVPAYGLLNARLGLRLADSGLDLAIWARNLTNEDYYQSRSGGAFGVINASVGDPRTFGATLRAKW